MLPPSTEKHQPFEAPKTAVMHCQALSSQVTASHAASAFIWYSSISHHPSSLLSRVLTNIYLPGPESTDLHLAALKSVATDGELV